MVDVKYIRVLCKVEETLWNIHMMPALNPPLYLVQGYFKLSRFDEVKRNAIYVRSSEKEYASFQEFLRKTKGSQNSPFQ